MWSFPYDEHYFVTQLTTLAIQIRDAVTQSLRNAGGDSLARPIAVRGGDTIYQLDVPAEQTLQRYCTEWGAQVPFLLIAEGLETGSQIFPAEADSTQLVFTLIVDPVDGTRGLMYGKRSAWTLLGIAPPPHAGKVPRLSDITVAVQSELPNARAFLADILLAVRGQGVFGETYNLFTGEKQPFIPRPSQADNLMGGFASIVKFFPGFKESAAHLEELLFAELIGAPTTESPLIFDDQYISSGGQLYELAMGHDRFIADFRPLLPNRVTGQSHLCSHPYDVCTALIATEAGVIVTDETGQPLDAPLDVTTSVAWVGYANTQLERRIAPILQKLLQDHSLP